MDHNKQHRLPPEKAEFARQLRRNSTLPERMLWDCLRAKRMHGIKFRRQHVIGPYVADFYCAAASLVIELDGESHDEQVKYDEERTKYMQQRGYTVVRYLNEQVLGDLYEVAEDIFRRVSIAAETLPRPLPKREGSGRGV